MISVDLETATGARSGVGPLATVTRWERTRRLDRAGAISFALPATDSRVASLSLRQYARGYGVRAGLRSDLGLGIVDRIETDTDARLTSASGDDLLRELAMRPAGAILLKSGTDPTPLTTALGLVLAAANAAPAPAWTLDTTTYGSVGTTTAGSTSITAVTNIAGWTGREGSPIYGATIPAGATVTAVGSGSLTISAAATGSAAGTALHRSMVFYETQDESVLEVLTKLAELTGTHFRLGTGRQIVWLWSVQPASGIRAVSGVSPAAAATNSEICLITGLTILRDSSDVLSHVSPFGTAKSGARTMLADSPGDVNKTTRTPPPGYALDLTTNTLSNAAAASSYGYAGKRQTWRNIATALVATDPAANPGLVSARNQLFDVAFEYLRTHSTPLESYRLDIAKLDREVLPGETIRLIYRDVVDGVVILSIDRDVLVLESTTLITDDGVLTPQLVVATLDRWPADDTALLLAMLREVTEARAERPA